MDTLLEDSAQAIDVFFDQLEFCHRSTCEDA